MLATLSNSALRTRCSFHVASLLTKRRSQLQPYTTKATQFKATLDGGTLYISEDAAKALGWTEQTPLDGVSLRLSGWGPHYFAITQKGTDADRLACATVESSRNPVVQATLEHLKKTDSE